MRRARRPLKIPTGPPRRRHKTVHVRGYCRNPVVRTWQKASQQAKEWGF